MSQFKVGQLTDFQSNRAFPMEVDGESIVLVRDGDAMYAVEDRCSHADVALSDGDVEGCQIECFLHGSRFDVRTGEALSLPATKPIRTFPTSTEDEDGAVSVFVEIG